jgi:predicted porin
MLNAQSFPDFQQREFAGKRRSTPHFNNQGELQMQKKIIALAIAAAFAAPVAAMAADSVTVYGSVDAGVRSETYLGKTVTEFGIPSGTYNSNRFGIKAVEDMGDGMSANVVLEGSLSVGTGEMGNPKTATGNTDVDNRTGLFDRQATVGVKSGAHSVDLGRQYSVAFKTVGLYEPLAYKFIKIGYGEAAAVVTRYNNDIAYTGTFGPVTVMAEHNIPAAANTDYATPTGTPVGDDSTSTNAIGVGYASGPITVGGAYSATKANNTIAVGGDTKYYTVGAGFSFGDGRVSAGYSNNVVAGNGTAATGGDITTKYVFIGGNYNITSSVGLVAAVYKKTAQGAAVASVVPAEINSVKSVLGVTYALSKKTKLYAEVDKTTVDNPTAASGTSNGFATNDNSGFAVGLAATF